MDSNQKYRYIANYTNGIEKEPINWPNLDFLYIFAPQAESINVRSVDTVFCGPNTKVLTPCNDIRRGEWYMDTEKRCILSKTDEEFKRQVNFRHSKNITTPSKEDEILMGEFLDTVLEDPNFMNKAYEAIWPEQKSVSKFGFYQKIVNNIRTRFGR